MRTKSILFCILLIASLVRLWQLGNNPPSLTWDEASWGYNAYSLGVDGRDEFGKYLPYSYLESFGDFKPPVYAYLDIIPVKLFGLTEFATRFPSAILGVLTVWLTFFLVKRIFATSSNKHAYALLSAFFLSISPWHIMLSRGAFEANVSSFFIVTGVWLFLYGVHNKWYLLTSIFSFIISFYTFNTARLVSPLLLTGLGICFYKEMLQSKKQIGIAIIGAMLIFAPSIAFFLSPQASLRFKEVNIFSDLSVIERTNKEIAHDNNSPVSKLIHNRRLTFAVEYIKHYLDHFNLSFLFLKGDVNPKFSSQDVGEMYLWDFPFFFIGILFLFKKKESYWKIIPLWLLIGIIPAAAARETPHALRIETTLPTFQILVAYGVVTAYLWIGTLKINEWKKQVICGGMAILLLCNITYFLHGYVNHYGKEFSSEWQYGYKDVVSYVTQVQGNYNHIYMTQALGRPYIYFLFYMKTDPSYFRKTASIQRDSFGFVLVKQFGKYTFSSFDSTSNRSGKILYIDSISRIPKSAKIIKEFPLLNGDSNVAAYIM